MVLHALFSIIFQDNVHQASKNPTGLLDEFGIVELQCHMMPTCSKRLFSIHSHYTRNRCKTMNTFCFWESQTLCDLLLLFDLMYFQRAMSVWTLKVETPPSHLTGIGQVLTQLHCFFHFCMYKLWTIAQHQDCACVQVMPILKITVCWPSLWRQTLGPTFKCLHCVSRWIRDKL